LNTAKFRQILRLLDLNGFHVHATAMGEEFTRWGNETTATTIMTGIAGIIAPPPAEVPVPVAADPVPAEGEPVPVAAAPIPAAPVVAADPTEAVPV
jgi:hypothetical protein